MKSVKNYLLGVAGLLALALAVVVWRQYQEIENLRTAALNTSERAELQKRAWDAEKRARQAELHLAAARASAGESFAPGQPPPEAGAAESAQSRVVGSVVNTYLATMNDPEAQRLMALQQKAAISARYADMFKKLQLPPDRLAEFKAELLDKQTLRNDVLLAAVQQGINPLQNPQEFRQLEATMQAEVDAKIKATLGENGYTQYQEYQATQGQRAVINQLQQSLSYTAAPLTTQQADQMTSILAQTGPPRSAAIPGGGTGAAGAAAPTNAPSKANARVTDQTVEQAQTVLLPPQVQALKEIQQQQQAAVEIEKLLRQNQGGSPAGLPGTPGMPSGPRSRGPGG